MKTKDKVLDLGGGTFPYRAYENEEVISVDFRKEVKPTIVHNLFNFPYPFEENSFDIIYASHIMEHMKDNVEVMEEIYRIAKSDAKVFIRVPHFSGRSAWCDPTHLRAYSYYQFKVQKVKLRYIRFLHGFFATKILNWVINYLANLNIKICEKTWCY